MNFFYQILGILDSREECYKFEIIQEVTAFIIYSMKRYPKKIKVTYKKDKEMGLW